MIIMEQVRTVYGWWKGKISRKAPQKLILIVWTRKAEDEPEAVRVTTRFNITFG